MCFDRLEVQVRLTQAYGCPDKHWPKRANQVDFALEIKGATLNHDLISVHVLSILQLYGSTQE